MSFWLARWAISPTTQSGKDLSASYSRLFAFSFLRKPPKNSSHPCLRTVKPPLVRIGDIARVTGRTVGELQSLARRPEAHYREHAIVKDGKSRLLTVPDGDLMDIQRRLHRGLLITIPTNKCVHSAPKRSILTNARAHLRHPYLSVFDIADCFPSVSPYRVQSALKRAGFRDDAALLVTKLTTLEHSLPLGAPTSPALLNAVFVDIDGKIGSVARANGLTFTPYYDDLCLSGGSRTPRLARVVENILAAHRLEISISKRHDWGPTDPHTVTKIMVNTSPSPLPEYVNSVQGLINAHRRGVRVLDATELLSLRGQVAYVNFVNPVAGSALLKLLDSPTQMSGISTR